MTAPDDSKLRAIADFLARLTVFRVMLGLLAAGGGVVIYALWEARAQWTPFLWQSQPLLIALLVGLSMIVVGAWMQSFQKQMEGRSSQLYQQMRDQINDLRRDQEEGRAERRELQASITELTAAERQCQERVTTLTRELEALKRHVRQQSGFGDLG